MRSFTDVLRFELRQHLRSPLFWGIALLFFGLHFLILTRTGIHLGENEQVAINSAWLIFQTVLVLGVFGMLPAIAFAVTAITRDDERNTVELFFTTPVPRTAFVLGRFSAGALAACAVGCLGLLGALIGSFMPWLDPARIAPFDWRPWAASLTLTVLPNLLVFCALFFSVAAATRSTAVTFGAAFFVLVLEVFVNVTSAGAPAPRWLLLADPFGALPIADVARYWTVSELNSQLPTGLLLPNRLLWLGFGVSALLFTVGRYRMELAGTRVARVRQRKNAATAPPPFPGAMPAPCFDSGATWRIFGSQFAMDGRSVRQSPLFWLLLALAAFATWTDAAGLKSPIIGLPLYPATSLMLDFVRFDLFQYVLLAIIYFSAALVHRERDSGIDGICGAAPCPDWIPVVSKTLVLCAVIVVLLAVSMGVSLAAQALAGFSHYELSVYLEGIFVNSGFYFCMLCVLAVLVQLLSPGRWSGMVLVLIVFIALLGKEALGFDQLLYGFLIPMVVHSDMNGFGHFRLPTYTLMAYWSAFCVLLLAAGHLLFPRGYYASWRERLLDARTRTSVTLLRACLLAAAAFVALGAFVFYNTNVLNRYVSQDGRLAAQARYELDYGRYRDAPAPSMVDPDLQIELYPSERRMESHGRVQLRNNTPTAIGEFVVSVDQRNHVDDLSVDDAAVVTADPAQGFYLVRPNQPLATGNSLTMRWVMARANRGFPNSAPDNDIVANGSYLVGLIPTPGYCVECELTTDRGRFGLSPYSGLPALGDPAHLDDLFPGINSRSSLHIVVGTDRDQTAVAPGELGRTWEQDGRRYFDYRLEGPVWPFALLLSARYEVARDNWNDVEIEVYHDAKHAWNVPAMIETAKRGLAYYGREFAPYSRPSFRIAEYPRYRSNVQAWQGGVSYSEGSGFLTDLRGWNGLDYATLHELAHQWWGNVYGARMQGRQFLNEGLAQYSTFMVYKELADPQWIRRILAYTHDAYLNARSGDSRAEQPVVRTEDQGNISYNKAPLALFALQDLVGADRVNGALRAYYVRFVDKGPPFPTSLDLVAELRRAAGPDYQALITDLFEKIVLYDTGIAAAHARPSVDGYDVTLDVTGRRYEADGRGRETESPLDAWFTITLFAAGADPQTATPLYEAKHRLHTGTQQVVVHVAGKPGLAAVDPFHLMIDRMRDNNLRAVD